ncbi:hypothetical protein KKA87_11800 [bacterium]|nr:hypothetical protein [bacterium]MBU1872424.1 hypothetical protein [bacterium]
MYRLINKNIKQLLEDIKKKDHIDLYIYICKSFEKRQSTTSEFKDIFRKFYRLNAARLSINFCELYFSLLEKNRNNRKIDVRDITNSLYELESNSRGIHAVHFSFASKLAHTIDNTLPIYDSMISTFYFFPDIKTSWTKDRKIEEYMANYQFLRSEYKRIIRDNLLKQTMVQFRNKFGIGIEYSDVKLIDTLIWRYTALLKSGAIRNGQIQYG